MAVTAAPLAIFGLDAADPDLLMAWARDGQLPTMASIMNRGTIGRLAGPEMISVHGVWPTFFSGVSVEQHGYYLRRTLVPRTYRIEALRPQDLGAPGFWARFRGRDVRLMTVDVPVSDPLPGMNGFQLLHWGHHPAEAPPNAQPDGLLEEIRALIGTPIRTDERQGSRRRDRRILVQISRRVEQKGTLCRYLMRKSPIDLAVVVFGDTHAAGHRFRKYQGEPIASAAGDGGLRNGILKIYRAIDREIGKVIEEFPRPPNVFVVTDSGIRDGYPMGDVIESFCRRLGYQTMLRPSTAVRRRLTPLRSRLSEPLRVLDRISPHRRYDRFAKGVDWQRTTAFAIPAQYTGYVRVNLSGREPDGVVEPGPEYERVLDRLEADFFQLVDDENGSPLVERVTRTAQVFGGGPPLRLPDMIVNWKASSRRVERIVHPRAAWTRKTTGDPRGNHHSDSGLVLAAGPSIQQHGFAGDFSPLEFAPLFLALMGEPTGIDAGRAATSFLRSHANQDRPPVG